MEQVVWVRALSGCRLEVGFSDGLQGEIDVEPFLFGPMYEPLREPTFFEQVFVDSFGAVAWPNGADISAAGLHRRLERELAPAV